MRDASRIKEKIEVSLDNRQVFYLFFGGAVLACLVFVIGVLVGKRLEARKHKRQRPGGDELAMIDANAKRAGRQLTFHDELVKPDPGAHGNLPPEVLEWRDMGQSATAPPTPAVRPRPARQRADARRARPARRGQSPAFASRRGPGALASRGPSAERAPTPAKASAAEQAGRYTLQVGAFQTKAEAERMRRKLEGTGYRTYVVASKVRNRGVWFRVRLGDFESWNQAARAKRKFERKVNKSAYISKR